MICRANELALIATGILIFWMIRLHSIRLTLRTQQTVNHMIGDLMAEAEHLDGDVWIGLTIFNCKFWVIQEECQQQLETGLIIIIIVDHGTRYYVHHIMIMQLMVYLKYMKSYYNITMKAQKSSKHPALVFVDCLCNESFEEFSGKHC